MVLAGPRFYFTLIRGRAIVAPLVALVIPSRTLGECGWTLAVDNTFGQPSGKR